MPAYRSRQERDVQRLDNMFQKHWQKREEMKKINGQNFTVSRNLFIPCDLIFTYVLECDADVKIKVATS